MQGDQITTITKHLLGLGVAVYGNPRQDMGPKLADGGQKLDAGEVAVTHHEHARLD
jgi:hypothetical protein